MISRYEVKEITQIWSEESRYAHFLKVEVALLQALEKEKMIPSHISAAFKNVKINPERVREIEETTRHDVIAFCTSITEQVDADAARYFHFGVTSSDILDTALTLQIRESLHLVIPALKSLLDSLDGQVEKTKDLLSMGRSHGMAAEPMVFAQKFLSSRTELKRRLDDYEHALKTEMTGQLSGAVGNYTVVTPAVEMHALAALGLQTEAVSTQVIPRDRLAKIVSIGALTASALERLAVEIRHLHHSDIAEVHEGFKAGQKGSSTMPHKKNPISSENISGLARVIKSHLTIALENNVLWHERDISHSSAERLYLPDHFGLLTYSLRRMASTIRDLEVHRDQVQGKVDKNFTTLSSFILHSLIRENAVPREELYAIVQAASFQAKSLDELVSAVSSRVASAGLKWNADELNWEQIRKTYFERFQSVLKRSK
jgi:adenylosuccinate lyase